MKLKSLLLLLIPSFLGAATLQPQHQAPMTVDVPQNGNVVGITINQNDTTNNPNAITTNGSVQVGSLICTGAPCGSGGSGSGPSGQINFSAQYAIPYYSLSGSSNVVSGLLPGTSGQILATGGSGLPYWTSALTNPFTVSSGTVQGQLSVGGPIGVGTLPVSNQQLKIDNPGTSGDSYASNTTADGVGGATHYGNYSWASGGLTNNYAYYVGAGDVKLDHPINSLLATNSIGVIVATTVPTNAALFSTTSTWTATQNFANIQASTFTSLTVTNGLTLNGTGPFAFLGQDLQTYNVAGSSNAPVTIGDQVVYTSTWGAIGDGGTSGSSLLTANNVWSGNNFYTEGVSISSSLVVSNSIGGNTVFSQDGQIHASTAVVNISGQGKLISFGNSGQVDQVYIPAGAQAYFGHYGAQLGLLSVGAPSSLETVSTTVDGTQFINLFDTNGSLELASRGNGQDIYFSQANGGEQGRFSNKQGFVVSSSETIKGVGLSVLGANGINATYNVKVGSLTLGNVASGTQCLHADSSGNVTGTGSDCGAGGGGASVTSTNTWTANQTFNNQIYLSSAAVITSSGSTPALLINANGGNYGTNSNSGALSVFCNNTGTQGNCGNVYSDAGVQNQLNGVWTITQANSSWNTVTEYMVAAADNPQNGIRIDGFDYSTIEFIDTLQNGAGPGGGGGSVHNGKFQISSHNDEMRGERRRSDNSQFDSAWVVDDSTGPGIISFATDYSRPVSTVDIQGSLGIGKAVAGNIAAPVSGLLVQGNVKMQSSLNYTPHTITGNYTATSTDAVILANFLVTGGTITLPASSVVTGQQLTISKVDTTTGPVTIIANGSDIIAGTGTLTLNAFMQTDSIMSDGNGHWIPWGQGIQLTPTLVGVTDALAGGGVTFGTSSTTYVCPFDIPVPVSIAAFRVYIQAGTGDSINFGIYDSFGNLVVSTGPILIAGGGQQTYKLATPVNLPPGQYSYASQASAAAVEISGITLNGANGSILCSSKSGSSMVLPNPYGFPGGSTGKVTVPTILVTGGKAGL